MVVLAFKFYLYTKNAFSLVVINGHQKPLSGKCNVLKECGKYFVTNFLLVLILHIFTQLISSCRISFSLFFFLFNC